MVGAELCVGSQTLLSSVEGVRAGAVTASKGELVRGYFFFTEENSVPDLSTSFAGEGLL